MIYLDSAATTLRKPPSVARASAWAIGHLATPGRGGHRPAMAAAETAFACRRTAAALFHVPEPERVVFTSSATHGLNIALKTLVNPGGAVVISGYEHNAVTRPLRAIPDVTVKVASAPLFDRAAALEAFDRALTEEVDAAVCTHVSNVFGAVLPIEAIAALCRRREIPLVIDASQSAGCLPLDFAGLGAAFIAMPGHKGLLGPQGTGVLICGAPALPIMAGGTGSASREQDMPASLPDRLEAGTHNIPGIAGLLEGVKFVRRLGPGNIARRERVMLRALARELALIPGLEVFVSADAAAQAGVLSVRHERAGCEELGEALGRLGVCVRAGLHCAPLAHESAGTLESGTVRLSLSPFNTPQELRRVPALTERAIYEALR